ncbi:MAG: thiosulfate oxidation carrier complex protein SoxZ [Thiotrichales bacterium]
MASLKLRAEESGGVTTVKTLITHPMETGLRKDKATGEVIPAHFIQEVVAEHKGNQVFTAHWSGSISTNPYLSFRFKGAAKGDSLKVSWTDNKGGTDSADVQVS